MESRTGGDALPEMACSEMARLEIARPQMAPSRNGAL